MKARRQGTGLQFILLLGVLGTAGVAQTEWQRVPAMVPLYGARFAYDSSRDRIMLFGGELASGDISSDLWEWNGFAWALRSSAVQPPPRWSHAMVFDTGRRRLVLFGGSGKQQTLADTWEWDGSNWIQLRSGTGPSPRFGHMMTYDPARRRTILFGGYSAGSLASDTWEWDGAAWTRQTPSTAPSPRAFAGLVFDPVRNRALLHGGTILSAPLTAASDTWEYDGTTWRRLSNTGPARSSLAMFFDSTRGCAVAFGGWDSNFTIFGDSWLWDGQQWTRSNAAGPIPRYLTGAAYDTSRGRGVLFGGGDYYDLAPPETWEWDGSRWLLAQWLPDLARSHHAMAHDGNAVIAFGGLGRSGALSETLRWSGAEWLVATTPLSPPPRANHTMAFDSRRRQVVLFGGDDGFALRDDTWLWDGSAWTAHTGAARPTPRRAPAMAFDRSRQRTVLFGGFDGGAPTDTWEFDGTSWSRSLPARSPTPREGAAMAYDEVRDVVILFGGEDLASRQRLNDTWEWDGTNWTRLQPSAAPSPRTSMQVTEDTARHRIVLVNGVFQLNPETWEWDGSTWLRRTTASMPRSFVINAAMAYDPVADETIWFGGYAGRPSADTWIYRTVDPARFTTHYRSCPSSVGLPQLAGERPWLGERLTITITDLPQTAPAVLLLGFSATTLFGSIPLPLDVTPLGLTGCTLYTDIAATLPMVTATGVATWSTTLCACPNLVGMAFYCQALIVDPPANPAGLILTNAGAGTIGVK